MLEKKVIRYTRGGMQEVNLATGEKHQLTESKERVFHPNQEQRFHDEKNIPQQIRQTIRIQDRTLKAAPSHSKTANMDAPLFRPSRTRQEGAAKKKTYRVVEKRSAARSAAAKKGAARTARSRVVEKENMQRRIRMSFHNAALTQTVLKGGANQTGKQMTVLRCPLYHLHPVPSRRAQISHGDFSGEEIKRTRKKTQRRLIVRRSKKRQRSKLPKDKLRKSRLKLHPKFSSKLQRERPQRLQKLRQLRFR